MGPADMTEKKLLLLGEQNYARDGTLPVLSKGSAAWNVWHTWRKEHGLSVRFMEYQQRWTVPCEIPPVDLQALDDALHNSLRRGKRTYAE